MFKKIVLAFVVFISTVSLGYSYYSKNLDASGSPYQVSANATVKLGEKGQFPNGTNGSMVKGDKVYVGVVVCKRLCKPSKVV